MYIAGNLSLNRDNHGFHGGVHDRFLVDEKVTGGAYLALESPFDENRAFEGHLTLKIDVLRQDSINFRFVYMLYAKIRHRLCLPVS